MNDLNTQQIVLLCLLVSFVTSIATGITTVSLLEQAPDPVTQTINRVVERTVERVIEPVEVIRSGNNNEDKKEDAPRVERIVETVVVNQEDLTVDAVQNNQKVIAKIYILDRFENKDFAGVGIVISSSGGVITNNLGNFDLDKLEVEYSNGATSTLTFSNTKTESMLGTGINVFEPGNIVSVDNYVNFGDSQSLKLGQTVIALSGGLSNSVETGIITAIESIEGEIKQEEVSADVSPAKIFTNIKTSIKSGGNSPVTLLINLKGNVVGIKIGGTGLIGDYVPSNYVSSRLI